DRERTRAAARPARVRSRTVSRSKLRQRAEDVELQTARRRRCVDRLRERSEADLARMELVDRLDQVRQTSAQPVQAPYHQRVPSPRIVKAGIQLRPMLQRSRTNVTEHS